MKVKQLPATKARAKRRLAALPKAPGFAVTQRAVPKIAAQRRALALRKLGLGHVGKTTVLPNTPLIRKALVDLRPLITIQPSARPAAHRGDLRVDRDLAAAIDPLPYTAVMPDSTLTSAVLEVQRFRHSEASEETLERRAELIADALRDAGDEPLTDQAKATLDDKIQAAGLDL